MEQNNADSLFGLQVDHESRNHFKEAGKWSNFVAVIFIVCFGLLLLLFLIAGSALLGGGFNRSSAYQDVIVVDQGFIAMQYIAGVGGILYLIYGGLMLIRFATYVRRGVEMQDQQSFNHGLKGLRNFFVVSGIFAIIGIIGDIYEMIQIF